MESLWLLNGEANIRLVDSVNKQDVCLIVKPSSLYCLRSSACGVQASDVEDECRRTWVRLSEAESPP